MSSPVRHFLTGHELDAGALLGLLDRAEELKAGRAQRVGNDVLGAFRALSAAIPPGERAGVISALLVVGFTSVSVPAVLAGLAVTPLGVESTFEIFGTVVACLALVIALQAWRMRAAPTPASTQLATEACQGG